MTAGPTFFKPRVFKLIIIAKSLKGPKVMQSNNDQLAVCYPAYNISIYYLIFPNSKSML